MTELMSLFFFQIKNRIFRNVSQPASVMPKTNKILNYTIFLIIIVLLITACAPSKKNPFYEKRRKSSEVNASQLGRNKYYFSKDYQKKLSKTFKKKK